MNTFKNIMPKKAFLYGAGLVLAGLMAFAAVSTVSHSVEAAGTGSDMHGYAWSSTIGWVSLNCLEGSSTGGSACAGSNYKVTMDPATKVFSGQAWSSNVGWVSFDAADTASCGAVASLTTANKLVGWARVLNGATILGSDGCISLSGTSYGPVLNITTNAFSGFAWGSVNVGWLSFDYASLGAVPSVPPTVDMKASNDLITWSDNPTYAEMIGSTYSTSLKWTSAGVSSCQSSASPLNTTWPNGGSQAIASSSYVKYPATSGTYTFTITCVPTDTVTYPSNVSDTVTITVVATQLLVNKASSATVLSMGGPAKLTWTTAATTPCTTSRTIPSGFTPPLDWAGTRAPSAGTVGQIITLPANTTSVPAVYTYTLSCMDGSGTAPKSSTVTVTVSPVSITPSFNLTVDGSSSVTVAKGTSVTLAWNSQYIQPGTCVASSAPAYSGWNTTSITTSSTGTPAGGTYVTGPMTAAQDFTVSACVPVGGGTPITRTVHVDIASGTGGGTGGHRPPWMEF